jgi:hypothetical protein
MGVADTGYPTQIVPYVGLFATQPTSPNGPGPGQQGGPQPSPGGNGTPTSAPGPGVAHTFAVHAPASLSVTRARHGTKVTVTHVPQGQLVTATLTLGRRIAARAARHAGATDTVTIILTPDRTSAKRLHPGDQLRITITAGGVRVVRTIRLRTGR